MKVESKNTVVSYQEIKESFRDYVRNLAILEDERSESLDPRSGEKYGLRSPSEEPAMPTPKMTVYIEDLAQYLIGDQVLMDVLTCIIEGRLLFRDQLFGYGYYEGMGIMSWLFSIPAEWKVDSAIRENRAAALKLQAALKNL